MGLIRFDKWSTLDFKSKKETSLEMADPPRKRVSTSYKRYIKEHTGKEGVPPSSKRAFMESYKTEVTSRLPSSSDDTKNQQSEQESVLCEDEGESSQHHSVDDINLPSCHATGIYSGHSEGYSEGGIEEAALFQDNSISGQQSDVPGDSTIKIEDFQQMKYDSHDHDMQEITDLYDDFGSTCSSDDLGIIDDELSEEDCPNSDDEDFGVESNFNSYIYKGAQITLSVSILLILAFTTRHSLTSEGITELLHLLALHCTAGHCLQTTLYSFKKYFHNVDHPLIYHKYCSFCLLGIETSNEMDTCQNPLCSKKLNEEGSVSGFMEIPIESQLQSMFKRPGFTSGLMHKSRSTKTNEEAIEDICDGVQYKKLVADGILKSEYDLTLTFNTDGAKPFRSSKTSLWPIYLMINELPYAERRMPENMVLAGIWYGAKKPSMAGFLTPFMKTLKGLEKGFVASTPDGEVECRVILIASTCDLPARACVCAMNQYNGQSSCVKCLQTGKVVKVGKGHTRVFPPNMDCLDGPARSDNSVTKDALDAVRLKVPVNGIKGPSWFSYLTFFSFVHGTGIDYMHGVLLGVTKLMHSLWFASKHSAQVFSVAGFIEKVNRRLLQIKPPNYMSRLPRSLMDTDYWKASEWKYWLLYYAPTVMHDVLMPEYYRHFLCFSESIFLLLQDSIKPSDIHRSRILLARFVAMFPVMYGESLMTLNVHQLLHLSDNVQDLGPLWCFSCFPFEDANVFLLKLFNGTQHIDKQIAHAVAVIQKMPELIPAIEKNSVAYDLYCRLKNKSKYKGTMLGPGIYLIGATKFQSQLSPEYDHAVKERVFGPFEKLVTFKRVKVDGDVYFSEAYKRVLLRNSCTVLYERDASHMYGIIETFLQVSPVCQCDDFSTCACVTRNFAMIRCLEVTDNFMGVNYIKEVKSNDQKKITAVDLNALKRKCVFIKVHDSDSDAVFLCNVPNVLEKD